MRSAQAVALALLAVASSVGAVVAEDAWPWKPRAEVPWPSEMARAERSASPQVAQRQECVARFTSLRSEVEKRGMAAKNASERGAVREDMCKVITAYGAAETNWIKYAESNMSRCGIPQEIVTQMKTVHAKTADGQKKLCAAGFQLGAGGSNENSIGPGNSRENYPGYRINPDYPFGPPKKAKPLELRVLDIAG